MEKYYVLWFTSWCLVFLSPQLFPVIGKQNIQYVFISKGNAITPYTYSPYGDVISFSMDGLAGNFIYYPISGIMI